MRLFRGYDPTDAEGGFEDVHFNLAGRRRRRGRRRAANVCRGHGRRFSDQCFLMWDNKMGISSNLLFSDLRTKLASSLICRVSVHLIWISITPTSINTGAFFQREVRGSSRFANTDLSWLVSCLM